MNRVKKSGYNRGFVALAFALSQTMLLTPLAVQADGIVSVAGQTVFTNQAASGGMSAEDRAAQIQRNLDNALVASQDRSPSSISIVYVKGMPVITLGGYQVVTVDAENAKAAGTTPALLAQRWADALKHSLQDSGSVSSYVAQLSGPAGGTGSGAAGYPGPGAGAGYNPPNSSSEPPPQNGVAYQPYNNPGYSGQAGAPGSYGGGPPPNGYGGQGGYGGPGPGAGYDQYNRNSYGQPMQRGRVVYAPAGLVLPVSLKTSISTQAASSGDLIEAQLNDTVALGEGGAIPAGSVLVGQITEAKAGGFLGRSGMLGIKFNRIRTPDGMEAPISAHIDGGIGKYANSGNDVVKGETWKNKVGQGLLRGAIGAGTGAALGTAVGAIAGRGGRGAGRGAWSGTAIGGGLGVADSLLLRKGKDVTIKSGTAMKVQLDAPASLSGGGQPYSGNL